MAAAVTSTIKLATGITLVTERNPLILAKQIAVLDLHSHGRFLFGVGTGWNREETTLMGGDFDHRWTQAREAVLALKELWTKDEAEFQDRKSTRLNSSHSQISYAVFCLKKKKIKSLPRAEHGGTIRRQIARRHHPFRRLDSTGACRVYMPPDGCAVPTTAALRGAAMIVC